jgi:hypothetical protein
LLSFSIDLSLVFDRVNKIPTIANKPTIIYSTYRCLVGNSFMIPPKSWGLCGVSIMVVIAAMAKTEEHMSPMNRVRGINNSIAIAIFVTKINQAKAVVWLV